MRLLHDEVARERVRDLLGEAERERLAARLVTVRRARQRVRRAHQRAHRTLARLHHAVSIIG